MLVLVPELGHKGIGNGTGMFGVSIERYEIPMV